MSKVTSIRHPLFPAVIHYCRTVESLIKRVKKDIPDYDTSPHCRGKAVSWYADERFNVAMWAESPASLAHECTHAKNFIFQQMGQPLNIDDDEIEAYTIEHMFREYCSATGKFDNKEPWR